MSDPRKRGLGRGLSALMADLDTATVAPDSSDRRSLPIEQIAPNPDQPRRSFDPAELDDLAQSLRARGVLQPLIVRPHPADPTMFQIVAGERRWRAAQIAQLHDLPVIVRDFSDAEVLEVALIENVQRANLNAIEEAASYRQLMERFGHTQEKLAEAVNKSRSHIANLLRLLNLPEPVQAMLRDGRLTAGHARALVTAPNALDLARRVIDKGLSVRETEALVANRPATVARPRPQKDADTRALEADLSAHLRMRVSVDQGEGESGQVTIRYGSLEQLDALCRLLSGEF